jgi:hypothetical protein
LAIGRWACTPEGLLETGKDGSADGEADSEALTESDGDADTARQTRDGMAKGRGDGRLKITMRPSGAYLPPRLPHSSCLARLGHWVLWV